jgi:hypothetical protein
MSTGPTAGKQDRNRVGHDAEHYRFSPFGRQRLKPKIPLVRNESVYSVFRGCRADRSINSASNSRWNAELRVRRNVLFQ